MPCCWTARGWDRSKWSRRWKRKSAAAPRAVAEVTTSMRDRYSWLLYEMGYWISMTGLTLGFRYRFEGRRHVPPTGPALLIANHQSFLDPMIVGYAARRHL